MKPPRPADSGVFQDRVVLWLVIAVTLAFAWILWPFYGAVFWATVLAILFAPVYRRLSRRMRQRRTLAALSTLMIILVIVILPAGLVTGLLLQEALGVYGRIQAGELSVGRYLQHILDALPAWAGGLLERFGLTSLGAVQAKFAAGLTKSIQFFAGQALSIGQNTLDFVVSFFVTLYLLFFLLRDGEALARRIRDALPLQEDLQRNLSGKFTNVIRATVKGNIVIAIIQGVLGGLIFWILGIQAPVLWAVVMAFLSLLPAVGTAIIWLPVAVYMLVTGAVWQGTVLIAYGVLVIGLVDNVLRPILVGKDTKLPDYVVLISTLGGMSIFGFNGFVIGPIIAAMFIAVWDVVAASRAGIGTGRSDR
jgi:predicted PurR-regulated permease PerM